MAAEVLAATAGFIVNARAIIVLLCDRAVFRKPFQKAVAEKRHTNYVIFM